jgi:hypothetical protein
LKYFSWVASNGILKTIFYVQSLSYVVIHVDRVKLRLWTAATNKHGHPPGDTISMRSHGGMVLTGENRRPVTVPLRPPQIPHKLTREWTRASGVRGRWLTAWAITRPPTLLIIQSPSGRGWIHCKSECVRTLRRIVRVDKSMDQVISESTKLPHPSITPSFLPPCCFNDVVNSSLQFAIFEAQSAMTHTRQGRTRHDFWMSSCDPPCYPLPNSMFRRFGGSLATTRPALLARSSTTIPS